MAEGGGSGRNAEDVVYVTVSFPGAFPLAFLKRVGLSPIVLHGAGPQLNAELEKRGIVSDYVEGVRVTTPEILEVALQVFLDTNLVLCDALEVHLIKYVFCESVFGHEAGHRGECREDRPELKSYVLGACVGQV